MKTRIWIALAMVILLGIIFGAGCASGGKSLSVLREQTTTTEFNMDVVRTAGNNSYIPLNISGSLDDIDNANIILESLAAFERAHPELDIASWQLENIQRSYSTAAYIYGIWVTHRPKY